MRIFISCFLWLICGFIGTLFLSSTYGAIPSVRPGDGYPGRLAPYPTTLELRKKMARFRMSAGWFHRNPLPPNTNGWLVADSGPSDSLPYLLFSPRRVNYPVPMVVYFGGTGEHGTNLVRQFNQPVVFERVTSPDFQRRNPCYVFAPMLPEGGQIRHALPVGTSALSDLTCDAMYAVIASLKRPPVDTNRLYLTGLSWGGVAAFELSCGYPGRFAAAVPVSCLQTPLRIPAEKPGNYWLFHNESSYRSEGSQWAIREMERIVRAGGRKGGGIRRAPAEGRLHGERPRRGRRAQTRPRGGRAGRDLLHLEGLRVARRLVDGRVRRARHGARVRPDGDARGARQALLRFRRGLVGRQELDPCGEDPAQDGNRRVRRGRNPLPTRSPRTVAPGGADAPRSADWRRMSLWFYVSKMWRFDIRK